MANHRVITYTTSRAVYDEGQEYPSSSHEYTLKMGGEQPQLLQIMQSTTPIMECVNHIVRSAYKSSDSLWKGLNRTIGTVIDTDEKYPFILEEEGILTSCLDVDQRKLLRVSSDVSPKFSATSQHAHSVSTNGSRQPTAGHVIDVTLSIGEDIVLKVCAVVTSTTNIAFDYQDDAAVDFKSKGTVHISISAGGDHDHVVRFRREVKRLQPAAEAATTPSLYIVKQTPTGKFALDKHPVRNVNHDVALHYGETLAKRHELIVDRLTNSDHGLILLHGDPGTGKTSYIRHVIGCVPNKKFCLITPDVFPAITQPAMASFIAKHTSLVFIIEDAESMLTARGAVGDNPSISTLLNLGDGLLGDAMRVQVIATFNCSVDSIDRALMRDGRLIAAHKFGPLSTIQANAMYKYLGSSVTTDHAETLSHIYATVSNEKALKDPDAAKTSIGFV